MGKEPLLRSPLSQVRTCLLHKVLAEEEAVGSGDGCVWMLWQDVVTDLPITLGSHLQRSPVSS